MKEVVWIFGNSAASKETFIKYVNGSRDEKFYDRLGWKNKKVKASASSIDNIGQYENDPITQNRDHILAEVPQLFQEADVVLIKWQTVDSQAGRIEKLMALLPDARHRIILISTPQVELMKRLPNKSWWDDDDAGVFIREETKNLNELVDERKKSLPITRISGDPEDNYRPILK